MFVYIYIYIYIYTQTFIIYTNIPCMYLCNIHFTYICIHVCIHKFLRARIFKNIFLFFNPLFQSFQYKYDLPKVAECSFILFLIIKRLYCSSSWSEVLSCGIMKNFTDIVIKTMAGLHYKTFLHLKLIAQYKKYTLLG